MFDGIGKQETHQQMGEESRHAFLSETLTKKSAVKEKPADDDLGKSVDLVINSVSANGNFGGLKTRESIGNAVKAANESGKLDEFAQRINKELSQKNLEGDFQIVVNHGTDKDKKIVEFDLHEDSVTDGMTIAVAAGSKLEPMKAEELDAVAQNIAKTISDENSMGDRNEKHDIQTAFIRAKLSDLADQLTTRVDEDLVKGGHQEFYLAKREQFKDSSGKPIPEVVLHFKETADTMDVLDTKK